MKSIKLVNKSATCGTFFLLANFHSAKKFYVCYQRNKVITNLTQLLTLSYNNDWPEKT